MVIKEKTWIDTHQGDILVQNPSCIITMIIMFLGFNVYNQTILSS